VLVGIGLDEARIDRKPLLPLPLPGMPASAFSKSCAGDEAAAAPEGQVGPEPCSQNRREGVI
jgi:hypothetical protein